MASARVRATCSTASSNVFQSAPSRDGSTPDAPPASSRTVSFVLVSPSTEMALDRKSTRLNSSHSQISYAVFCLKKKNYHAYNQYITKINLTSPSRHYVIVCLIHHETQLASEIYPHHTTCYLQVHYLLHVRSVQ